MARIFYDQDAVFLRAAEAERIESSSPDCEYYSLNRGKNVDALYNEPTNDPLYGGSDAMGTDAISNHAWNFTPDIDAGEEAVTFPCAIEYQEMENKTPIVREEGLTFEHDAIARIARDHWECVWEGTDIEGRVPKEGDVIYIFEKWFDVTKAGKGGYICGSNHYVGFSLELRLRTLYTPDRKITS